MVGFIFRSRVGAWGGFSSEAAGFLPSSWTAGRITPACCEDPAQARRRFVPYSFWTISGNCIILSKPVSVHPLQSLEVKPSASGPRGLGALKKHPLPLTAKTHTVVLLEVWIDVGQQNTNDVQVGSRSMKTENEGRHVERFARHTAHQEGRTQSGGSPKPWPFNTHWSGEASNMT